MTLQSLPPKCWNNHSQSYVELGINPQTLCMLGTTWLCLKTSRYYLNENSVHSTLLGPGYRQLDENAQSKSWGGAGWDELTGWSFIKVLDFSQICSLLVSRPN